MTPFSLRGRLLLGSVVAIIVATFLAGVGINAISGLAVRALALSEIDEELRVLLAAVDINASNQLFLDDTPTDPRFGIPNGGFYWQVGRNGTVELRSQSLWEQNLPWLRARPRDAGRATDMKGPNGSHLLAVERSISIPSATGDQIVDIVMALDNSELAPARWRFFYAMAPSLGVLSVALIGAVVVFLRYGLRPLNDLRTALMAVQERSARKITGQFPREVQPLVDDLNGLLASRETQLTQARARAGDLAHGLKTPLAALEATARMLSEEGMSERAAAIQAEVSRMEAQIKRTLAQTRASLAAAHTVGVMDASADLQKIISVMRRLSADREIEFELTAPAEMWLAVDEADFADITGNLIDNARKWAAGRVEVRLSLQPELEGVRLLIEDDGPGLPEDAEIAFIRRGRRLDESIAGTGFGLAIAKDLAEAYDGKLTLARSDLGGLSVTVTLPARLVKDKQMAPEV
ncbi:MULTISPECIES: HAMP domain-containing sensor histidine kinase [unclassified Rhizobium]|uniref:sensor histidine kinase n=1 Tax=unclassified Rhizobium TaxID=2613769 RepID=UPI001620CD16|nr:MULTISPECIES: HAMP domain-containing sensor histidine kinase [unclassified Rhizobium]MBB3286917.1 signal transduction histidine kinase [Rhizobium sp. BK252]MBB3401657.1 signal transduction histidine kinase [Rhizobium sp. BK289]MBB3414399.1 signal transduction histidine kinase [Rhizobium sp. BK284]MBB3482287.1 signal transduction histidine kinase [Rhizobium sp. BK347]MDK4718412.1 HAMP domain-containing sensor histidine kinase [Rhizobium sp. CNPSo 3968]